MEVELEALQDAFEHIVEYQNELIAASPNSDVFFDGPYYIGSVEYSLTGPFSNDKG